MLGRLKTTDNLDKKVSASSSYYQVLVVDSQGRFETLLLTANDLTRVRDRVKKNPEDEIYPSWWDKVISFLGSLFSA